MRSHVVSFRLIGFALSKVAWDYQKAPPTRIFDNPICKQRRAKLLQEMSLFQKIKIFACKSPLAKERILPMRNKALAIALPNPITPPTSPIRNPMKALQLLVAESPLEKLATVNLEHSSTRRTTQLLSVSVQNATSGYCQARQFCLLHKRTVAKSFSFRVASKFSRFKEKICGLLLL